MKEKLLLMVAEFALSWLSKSLLKKADKAASKGDDVTASEKDGDKSRVDAARARLQALKDEISGRAKA